MKVTAIMIGARARPCGRVRTARHWASARTGGFAVGRRPLLRCAGHLASKGPSRSESEQSPPQDDAEGVGVWLAAAMTGGHRNFWCLRTYSRRLSRK